MSGEGKHRIFLPKLHSCRRRINNWWQTCLTKTLISQKRNFRSTKASLLLQIESLLCYKKAIFYQNTLTGYSAVVFLYRLIQIWVLKACLFFFFFFYLNRKSLNTWWHWKHDKRWRDKGKKTNILFGWEASLEVKSRFHLLVYHLFGFSSCKKYS